MDAAARNGKFFKIQWEKSKHYIGGFFSLSIQASVGQWQEMA